MCLADLAELSKAILTPLIAVVAVYIAWQQWKTNQQKLVLDRYDRRLRVYEEVKKILSIIIRDGNVSVEELLRFRTAVSEADFLFGPEIPEYIDTLYKHGVTLARSTSEYRDYTQSKPEGYDHQKVVSSMHEELNWLTEQFVPAKKLFQKYLDISK
jgi:hypothetical protein